MNSHLDEPQPTNGGDLKGYRPHILVVIVDRNLPEHVLDIIHKKNVHIPFSYVCMAEGTANSDIMDMLGLGSTDKAVLFCLIPSFYVSLLLDALNEGLSLHKVKKGVAFTIPLSGLSSTFLQVLEKVKQEVLPDLDPKKEVSIENHMNAFLNGQMGVESNMGISHDLVVAVINQGYSDELMDAARKAGATGGTIFHARRIGTEATSSFFGIPIQSEKEVVAVLTTRDNKHEIMQAINHSSGIKSEARGIVFSLPVDGVAGLDSGNMGVKE